MTLGQLVNGQTISKAVAAFLVALVGSVVVLLHGGAISVTDLEHAAELAAGIGLTTFLVPNRPLATVPAADVAAPPAGPTAAAPLTVEVPAPAGATAVPEGQGA